MPLGQKIFVFIGFSFILYSIIYLNYLNFAGRDTGPQLLRIEQEQSTQGTFYPYVTVDKDGGLMVYSSITHRHGLSKDHSNIHVKLATSSDDGDSWELAGHVFTSKHDMIEGFQGLNSEISQGTWRYEQPSIIYDPDDPGREYKVFALRYFWNGSVEVARQYGTIVLKTAGSKTDKIWPDDETWLFSASQSQPPPPYNGLVQLPLNRVSNALADVRAYTEPSAYYKDGFILLLLTAYTDISEDARPDRIVMIGSGDHGRSWAYLGAPISTADVAQLGDYDQISGGSIVEQDGRTLLMATYGIGEFNGLGTMVFEFEDLAAARLKRDANGVPVVLNDIKGIEKILLPPGTGRATWHEKLPDAGLLMPQVNHLGDEENRFAIFKRKETPLPEN